IERLIQDLADETHKSAEINDQLKNIAESGSEQRQHIDEVHTKVRDLRQKKSDIQAQKM
ncbi:unnamed protein product, partial [Didymodactylos carnosus]